MAPLKRLPVSNLSPVLLPLYALYSLLRMMGDAGAPHGYFEVNLDIVWLIA